MTGFLSMLLTLALLAGCAAGDGSAAAATQPISSDEPPTVSTENHRLIGELLPIPAEYAQEASEQGEVVRLDYTTADYVNPGRSLEKYAYVYLPHGFNATDPETQYDVLYLLHGGGGNAERYFDGAGQSSQFKRILDHMIQNGELKPMIVVTPTFYPIGNTDSSVSAAGAAAAHFSEELVNDLIPAVESAYPTYSENNLYFSVLEDGTHDYGSIRRYLYNAMPAFWGAEDAGPAPAIDTTGSYSVETEELYAENEGQQIYGLLYQPV